jgi:hypothetical protein
MAGKITPNPKRQFTLFNKGPLPPFRPPRPPPGNLILTTAPPPAPAFSRFLILQMFTLQPLQFLLLGQKFGEPRLDLLSPGLGGQSQEFFDTFHFIKFHAVLLLTFQHNSMWPGGLSRLLLANNFLEPTQTTFKTGQLGLTSFTRG